MVPNSSGLVFVIFAMATCLFQIGLQVQWWVWHRRGIVFQCHSLKIVKLKIRDSLCLIICNSLSQRIHNSIWKEIFYSRKNFQRPDLQKQPHRHFEQEVAAEIWQNVNFCAGRNIGSVLQRRRGLLHGKPQQGLLVHLHAQPSWQVAEHCDHTFHN